MRARLERMRAERVIERVWARDHTVWKPDPTEITDRLGWLDAPEWATARVDELRAFAAGVTSEGYRHVVLLGMGGSSLAPEVLATSFGPAHDAHGALELHVLDATDPAQVRAVEARVDLERTLFIVASKSGSTIETMTQFAYFWGLRPVGAQFVGITDEGSSLQRLGEERGFRRVFLNPSDIGGRYSALTYFGLVPAALCGVDLDTLLAEARAMAETCREPDPAVNPGAWLGAVLGEAALAGREQLTLRLPSQVATLGTWLEQLIAESTGKEGSGILPIEGEPYLEAHEYGPRRLFVAVGGEEGLGALAEAGQPVVALEPAAPHDLGREFFRWEFATAIASAALEIQPFDQPDVQAAKDASARFLGGGEPGADTLPLEQGLEGIGPEQFIAILAYVPREARNDARLLAARSALLARTHAATTTGYGPRYLHSTGQFHKGGPNRGLFVVVVGDDLEDLAVPGQTYSFSALKHAQAQGDIAALRERGRRVVRATLEELEELAGEARSGARS